LPTELTLGRNADEGISVYLGQQGGIDRYVGITNDIGRRQSEHGDLIRIGSIGSDLTRGQARAIARAQIVRARESGSDFINKRNSISPNHAYYGQAVEWGEQWLRANAR
jgi:hypothetical protein